MTLRATLMQRIDFYVQHLVKHQAREVHLVSNQPVLFRFPSGDRKSNSVIDHAQLTQLVQEAAPPEALQHLKTTKRAEFTHKGPEGHAVGVFVEADKPGTWKLVLRLGDASNAQATPPQAPQVSTGSATNGQAAAQPAAPVKPAAQAAKSTAGAATGGAEPPINRLLRLMVKMEASDLHLSSEVPPMVRLHGSMQLLEQRGPFSPEQLRSLLMEICPERNVAEFDETNDTDFAHTIEGVARFRANYFRDRKGVGGVFRQIPFDILPPEKLGIPKQVLDLCYLSKGLVLVTGPTGSGKSTTLATLIDVINQKRADHLITIEDPIEFVHTNKKCLVNQREVGVHTQGFKRALRAALREDPDIILVGEMRDLETISIAIETAETGHLVFGTLHTTTAPSTVDRIIDQFPSDRQAQIRTMLSESLRGVIAQVLCKKKGGGRVAGYEVLIANAAVSNLIREGKTYQLVSVMQTGKNQGMQTMNENLLQHVLADRVEPEEAYVKANDKLAFKEMLMRNNIVLQLD